MNVTGKSIAVTYRGTNYTLYNQRCREWTHPYAWQGKGTLTDSGCGVFSIANAVCFLGGERVKPEELPEEGSEAETATDFPEESIIVREALERLNDEDREILLLRYVNDEPVGTICRALGISRFALYRKIKNAEEELKKNLKEDE